MGGNCNYCTLDFTLCSLTPAALTTAPEKAGGTICIFLGSATWHWKLHHSNEELQCTLELEVKEQYFNRAGTNKSASWVLLIVSEFWGSNQAQGTALLTEKRPFLQSDLDCICNSGCQSSTAMLNPHLWWFLLIHTDGQLGGQEWAPLSPRQIWQGLSVWGTNPPSLGAASWGSQSGAKGQNQGLTLQMDQHLQPSVASCCCFNFLGQTLPDYYSPAQPSSVFDRQERSIRNPLGAGRNQHPPQLHLGPQLFSSGLSSAHASSPN